ncbi:hypothetical protein RchiOBHm_Chr5g0016131 [Rosa chinensis]|uniref:Uncharacterized protein n=1 Tax=Rosa chinensis TaxID=74649 RepID=A0A2P6Q662_ROSCH|nr:hypothetical protein RchiOBHm_Chr5g0016131 [Rosa chinensis]
MKEFSFMKTLVMLVGLVVESVSLHMSVFLYDSGGCLSDEHSILGLIVFLVVRKVAAPTALSKRHADGSLPIEDFNIVLENQSGKKVQMGSETDQQYDLIRVQAIMMSLMLHTNAKQLIKAQNYKDAMEVLSMEEEAFSLRSIGY